MTEEQERQALVAAARARLRAHLAEEEAALPADDPAREALAQVRRLAEGGGAITHLKTGKGAVLGR